jgi:hypothetical protein
VANTAYNTSGLIITNPPTNAEALLDLTPFFDEAALIGSSSFDVNGVVFLLSGSDAFSYDDSSLPYTLIFATGSDIAEVIADIVAAYPTVNSITPFDQFLSDISISQFNDSTLLLAANTAGSIGNTYYYISSSITTYFAGGWEVSATGSFSGFSVFSTAEITNIKDFKGTDLTSEGPWTFNTQANIPLYITNIEANFGTILLYPISNIIPQQ